jgi:hypothetical protein
LNPTAFIIGGTPDSSHSGWTLTAASDMADPIVVGRIRDGAGGAIPEGKKRNVIWKDDPDRRMKKCIEKVQN